MCFLVFSCFINSDEDESTLIEAMFNCLLWAGPVLRQDITMFFFLKASNGICLFYLIDLFFSAWLKKARAHAQFQVPHMYKH